MLWKREKYATAAGIRTTYLPALLPVGSKLTFGRYQVQAPAGLRGIAWFLHNKVFCKATSSLIQLLAYSSHIVVIRHRERIVSIPFATQETWVTLWLRCCLFWLNLSVVVLSPGKWKVSRPIFSFHLVTITFLPMHSNAPFDSYLLLEAIYV